MPFKNLNYYGYSKETYKNCLNLIMETNRHHARIINSWFAVLCLIVLFLSRYDYFVVLSGNPLVYISYFCLAFIWNIIVIVKKRFSIMETRFATVTSILLLLTFSLYSSIMQPYMSGVMFPVVLVLVAFSYIDTFYIMAMTLICGSILFVWTSYIFKPLTLTYVDGYNAIIFLILSLILHYSFQRMRISRYVTHYENINIQHNLEVRSSFDTLTSLLNRGRFFSMASEITKGFHEEYIVLCLFDLDEFKQINDQLGHQMGDKAIQIAALQIMKGFSIEFGEKWSFENRAVKKRLSFAGRLGGDEFVVFLRGRAGRKDVQNEAEKILASLAAVEIGELKGIHSSVGIAEISSNDHDIDLAYTKADEALYRSKADGKHTITFSKEG